MATSRTAATKRIGTTYYENGSRTGAGYHYEELWASHMRREMQIDKRLSWMPSTKVRWEEAFPGAPRYICTNHRCRHQDSTTVFRGQVGGPPPEPRCVKCGYKMVLMSQVRDPKSENPSGAE